MTNPGPADPSGPVQTPPGTSIGEQVPIHGTSELSSRSLSNDLNSSATRSQGTACGGSGTGTAAAGGLGSTGSSSGSTANAGCGTGAGTGSDGLGTPSILNSGSSSTGAIDVSKP